LLENFDPVSNTLKLSYNRKLEITEEDLHCKISTAYRPVRSSSNLDMWTNKWIHQIPQAIENKVKISEEQGHQSWEDG